MNEQQFEIYRVSDASERNEMYKRVNEMLKNGWRVVHLAGAGAKENGAAPSYAVVFEKVSQAPCIQ